MHYGSQAVWDQLWKILLTKIAVKSTYNNTSAMILCMIIRKIMFFCKEVDIYPDIFSTQNWHYSADKTYQFFHLLHLLPSVVNIKSLEFFHLNFWLSRFGIWHINSAIKTGIRVVYRCKKLNKAFCCVYVTRTNMFNGSIILY